MASARRLRTTSRQTSKSSEGGVENDDDGGEKGKHKKQKLSDMLGPPWNEEDLDHFYQAYRKYGKNWKKVSTMLHERTVEMVEALYGMNKAYLSLPEGAASAAGLRAMMTDHYDILEENRSDGEESSENMGIFGHSCKGDFHSEEKKVMLGDKLDSNPVPTTYSGPSPAKRRRTVRSRMALKVPQITTEEHARKTGKDMIVGKQRHQAFGRELDWDCKFNKAEKLLALTLAKASNCITSPEVSHTSSQKATCSLDKKLKEERRSTYAGACIQRTEKEEENADLVNVKPALLLTDKLSPERIKKRSRQLFCGDERSGLDTLATLADLSLNGLLPSPTLEQAKYFEEEKGCKFKVSQSNMEMVITDGTSQALVKEASGFVSRDPEGLQPYLKSKVLSASNLHKLPLESQKKKRRACADKLAGHGQASTEYAPAQSKAEVIPMLKQRNKVKRSTNSKSILLQPAKVLDKANGLNLENRESVVGVFVEDQSRVPDSIDISIQVKSQKRIVSEANLVDNPSLGLTDPIMILGSNLSNNNKSIVDEVSYCRHSTADTGPFTAKARLIHCLSSMVRRWSTCEWFYSAIDLPWFSQNEFVEYLNHAGLGKIPKLTRVEWGVIRSSLGKPRRFSSKFLQEEREKLEKFRDDARKCYYNLQSGTQSFLPVDLARPLTVGQRVSARHPRSRQIHDGRILTVDLSRCRVQFDRADLGVEFVPDIHVMPVHPVENMSELMRRQCIMLESSDRLFEDANFCMGRPICSAGGAARAALNETLERPGIMPAVTAPSHNFLNALFCRAQVDTVDSVAFAKAAANEAALAVQQATHGRPISTVHAHAREADVRALAELSRTLDKKEALLVELRNMNDEVDRNLEVETFQGSDLFQRQYATVVLQLKEVNNQVSTALLQLRHRNKYQDNLMPPWHAAAISHGLAFSSVAPSELLGPVRLESVLSVDETIAAAKKQARMMVFAATKALISLKDGEDALLKLGGALSGLSKDSFFGVEYLSYYNQPANVLGAELIQNIDCDMALHSNAGTLSTYNHRCLHDAPFEGVHKPSCIGKEPTLLTELMASCVATLLMVQACTDTHSQPSRVAVLLTSALENLRPRSPENHHIYHEIELCLDTLQSQILAQIPVESNVSSSLSFCYSRK